MAGAIGYALTQPAARSLPIFIALALGFAAPFTLLTFFPPLARRLPAPGAWMAIVKQALAFPMLAAVAWLIWVLDRQAGFAALATILACCLALSLAAWLYGMAQRRRLRGNRHWPLHLASALLLLLLLAPLTALRPGAPEAGGDAVEAAAPVAWSPGYVEAVKGQGKPILVNFTADWCITCQVNDRTTHAIDCGGKSSDGAHRHAVYGGGRHPL